MNRAGMVLLAVAAVLGVMLNATSIRSARAEPPAGAKIKLLMYGDSLTQYGMVPPTEKALNALAGGGASWVAVNGGKGGEPAELGKARIGPLLEKEKPAIVTVEYGWNDLARGYSPKQFREHMEGLIKTIQESGGGSPPKLVLMTVTPIDPARNNLGMKDKVITAKGGADRVIETEYNVVLRELAVEHGLGLIDMHRYAMTAKDPMGLFVKDGIHLNPEAYEFIGTHIAQGVLAYYNAEVLKQPAAVEARKTALAEAAAIEQALARGADRAVSEGRLDKVWKGCPYLAESAVAWHHWKYPVAATQGAGK